MPRKITSARLPKKATYPELGLMHRRMMRKMGITQSQAPADQLFKTRGWRIRITPLCIDALERCAAKRGQYRMTMIGAILEKYLLEEGYLAPEHCRYAFALLTLDEVRAMRPETAGESDP